MPPLDEGDLLYMPSTLPGISAREASRLLQQTDRLIKKRTGGRERVWQSRSRGVGNRSRAINHAGNNHSL